MGKKYTTIKIPEELKTVIYRILEETGEPLFWFENNSIRNFILSQGEVDKKWEIGKRSKAYIKRACMLPLYLIEDVSELLENYSKTKKQLNQMLLFVHWKRNVKREGKN